MSQLHELTEHLQKPAEHLQVDEPQSAQALAAVCLIISCGTIFEVFFSSFVVVLVCLEQQVILNN